MKNYLSIRLIVDIVLFLAIINGWWFIALPLIFLCFWLLPLFIEGLVAGIAYDALFGMTPEVGSWGYIGIIVVVVGWIAIRILKKSMRK